MPSGRTIPTTTFYAVKSKFIESPETLTENRVDTLVNHFHCLLIAASDSLPGPSCYCDIAFTQLYLMNCDAHSHSHAGFMLNTMQSKSRLSVHNDLANSIDRGWPFLHPSVRRGHLSNNDRMCFLIRGKELFRFTSLLASLVDYIQ